MRSLFLCAVVCSSACIIPAPSTESAPERQRAVLPVAPPIQVKNGANLGDKVEISGMIITPGRVAPGESVKISVFYKVLDEMQIDYAVFAHIEDVDGKVERLNADHPPAGGQYPTSKWKKGETVQDDFQVYVPPAMNVRGLNILMGFWDPKTDARLPLKNPEAIRNDGQNRILVGQFPVQQ
jgi:hypothetical protein